MKSVIILWISSGMISVVAMDLVIFVDLSVSSIFQVCSDRVVTAVTVSLHIVTCCCCLFGLI